MSGFCESVLQKDEQVDERTDRSEFIGSLGNVEIQKRTTEWNVRILQFRESMVQTQC